MTLTSTSIQAKVYILKAYIAQLAGKYVGKIRFGAGIKGDLKKLVFIESLIEDVYDQETITTSDDEYCLTEDQINSYFEQLPDLIGGICVDIYDIDITDLESEIGAMLAEDESFILGEDGSLILEE